MAPHCNVPSPGASSTWVFQDEDQVPNPDACKSNHGQTIYILWTGFRRWARTQTRLAAQWTLSWPVCEAEIQPGHWMRLLINRQAASSLANPRLIEAVIHPHICKRIHSSHWRQAKPIGVLWTMFHLTSQPTEWGSAASTGSPRSAQEQVRHWSQSAGACPSACRAGGPVDTQLSYGPASLRGAQFLPCYWGYVLMGAGINSYCKLSLVFLKIAEPKQPVVSSTGKSSKVWIPTCPRCAPPSPQCSFLCLSLGSRKPFSKTLF